MAFGKPELRQRFIKQYAGMVAREGAAGAVGAGHPRRQTHDGKARFMVSEAWNRGIVPVRMLEAQRLAGAHQPRTQRAVGAGLQGMYHALW